MKYIVGAVVIGMILLVGCGENGSPAGAESRALAAPQVTPDNGAPQTPAANNVTNPPALAGADFKSLAGMDEAVVSVNGQPLTMRQLVGPLIEAHGLTVLLNLVELQLAKEDAAKAKIVVTAKDFEDEREATLEKLCKSSDESKFLDAIDKAMAKKDFREANEQRKLLRADREAFLTQFLDNQHIDRVEFDIVLQINTYLRKIAEPQIADRITDAALHRAFGQMYGEKLRVLYIELNNMEEVGQAKRRLAAGDKFEDVARDMSHNRQSGALGGALPAFSRETLGLPDVFKQVAFDLKDGQVSDVVQYGTTYLLIKRIELIPPRAVKFETEKPIVFKTLYASLMDTVLKKLKQDLAAQVKPAMHFADPSSILAKQFDDRTTRMQAEADKKAREDLDRRQRLINANRGTTQPTTNATPGTAPTTGAAPQADPAAVGERPPATRPGPTTLPSLPVLVPETKSATVPTTGK